MLTSAIALDLVLSVVGDFVPEKVHSQAQLQRPTKPVKDKDGKTLETRTSDVPDLVSVHGNLAPSAQNDPSATLAFYYRLGQPFPGSPAFTWTINCEKGEIRLVAPGGSAMEFSPPDKPVTIEVHHFDTNEVDNVPWEWSELQKEVPPMGYGVQTCLYAFADKSIKGGEAWVDIEDAARRAQLFEGFFKSWDESKAK
jgi:predicted dehydrogenase